MAPENPPDRIPGPSRLTLTFDNGPTPGVTERVLEILARHGVRTTFFVIGQKLLDKSAAALLGEIKSAGHRIGNHTRATPSPSANGPARMTRIERSKARKR
jgi:peptidoglycan/xylan/chitin deacetylase (PgdA/CDA1 family)